MLEKIKKSFLVYPVRKFSNGVYWVSPFALVK
jgi:hypothetical protein